MPRAAKTKDQRVGSMSSQVPVWFWRRIRRLTADQESRGDDGAPGAGEIDSFMRVNLAEGCGAVNRGTRLVFLFIWFIWFVWLNETNQMNQINQINKTNQID
jgi:hypothetical protein